MLAFHGNNMINGSVGQAMMLPDMGLPQVFAGNQDCAQPNINILNQPPCNDPRTSVQVTKRVYETTVAEYWIADNGVQLQVGFGPASSGKTPANVIPADELITVQTDSTSTGVVRDITIAYDGYAEDGDDPRNDAGFNYGVFDGEVGRSFAECLSALLAGNIVIDNVPFPTVIPIAAAIKTVGGFSVYWDLGGITAETYKIEDAETLATVDMFRYAISPELDATHSHAPAPIEINLPESSDFTVRLEIPNRTIAPDDVQYGNGMVYVWTGIVTILIEKKTSLGSLPMQQNAAAPIQM